jgi:hypothetical protein
MMERWPRFLLDLSLWHAWHAARGTLPSRWKGLDLPGVCAALDTPCFRTVKPWRAELDGIRETTERTDSERILRWETAHGALVSRWTLGPDGDWWQAEYPVKTRDDLAAAREVAEARRYVVTPDVALDAPLDAAAPAGGDIIAMELPQRPWSELFHAFLGWSEGLMLFLEEPNALQGIVEPLEGALESLVTGVAALPSAVVLCPDNLDGQFISPSAFDEHLAPSYAKSAAKLHARGKRLVVHVGGPVRKLLPGLAGSRIDCVHGVCGAPQGDASLAEARSASGSGMTLWGGIAQDYLLENRTRAEFEAAVEAAFQQAGADPEAIIGVADRVPVDAIAERLEWLAREANARWPRGAS